MRILKSEVSAWRWQGSATKLPRAMHGNPAKRQQKSTLFRVLDLLAEKQGFV